MSHLGPKTNIVCFRTLDIGATLGSQTHYCGFKVLAKLKVLKLGDPERCHNQLNLIVLLYSNLIFATVLFHTLFYFTKLLYSTVLSYSTLLYSTLLYNIMFITCKVGQKNLHMVWWCGLSYQL